MSRYVKGEVTSEAWWASLPLQPSFPLVGTAAVIVLTSAVIKLGCHPSQQTHPKVEPG